MSPLRSGAVTLPSVVPSSCWWRASPLGSACCWYAWETYLTTHRPYTAPARWNPKPIGLRATLGAGGRLSPWSVPTSSALCPRTGGDRRYGLGPCVWSSALCGIGLHLAPGKGQSQSTALARPSLIALRLLSPRASHSRSHQQVALKACASDGTSTSLAAYGRLPWRTPPFGVGTSSS